MLLGVHESTVDSLGRLRVPQILRQAMAEQKEWFVSLDNDGTSLQLTRTGNEAQKREVDADGRMALPPELSPGFKSSGVRLLWKQDRVLVMPEEEYKRRRLKASSQFQPPQP